MATAPTTRTATDEQRSKCLRTEMEELLFNFYDASGITPGVAVRNPDEFLAEDFQGCFFVRATSELLCFDKAHVLAATMPRGVPHKAPCQLLSMTAAAEAEDGVTIRYAAGFRNGSMLTIRRGMMKATPINGQWKLRGVDEDVRVIVLPAAPRMRPAQDRPRVWFV